MNNLSLFQNSVSFGKGFGKTVQRSVFPLNLRLIYQKLKFWKILTYLDYLLNEVCK